MTGETSVDPVDDIGNPVLSDDRLLTEFALAVASTQARAP
jgi:hypothetical protein